MNNSAAVALLVQSSSTTTTAWVKENIFPWLEKETLKKQRAIWMLIVPRTKTANKAKNDSVFKYLQSKTA